jgi:hypothetical protein
LSTREGTTCIKNGIAYAGEQKQPLKISGVCPLEDYKLWVRFNNGEVKNFDFSKELNCPAFSPLKDKSVFNSVYIDYGVTVWNDGDIDIAPEYLYKNGVPAEGVGDA